MEYQCEFCRNKEREPDPEKAEDSVCFIARDATKIVSVRGKLKIQLSVNCKNFSYLRLIKFS